MAEDGLFNRLKQMVGLGKDTPNTAETAQPTNQNSLPPSTLTLDIKDGGETVELIAKRERLTKDLSEAFKATSDKLRKILKGETISEIPTDISNAFNTIAENTIDRVTIISETEEEQTGGTTKERIAMYRGIIEDAKAKKEAIRKLTDEAAHTQSTREKQGIVTKTTEPKLAPKKPEPPNTKEGPGLAGIQREIMQLLVQPHLKEGARAIEMMTPSEIRRTTNLDRNTTGDLGLAIVVAVTQLAEFFNTITLNRVIGKDRVAAEQAVAEVLQEMKNRGIRKDIVHLLITKIEPSLTSISRSALPVEESAVVRNLNRLVKELK